MGKEIGIGVVVTAIIVGAFAYYQYGDWWTPLLARFQAQPAAAPAPPPPSAAAPEAPPHHPVPVGTETGTPLPELGNSDDAMRSSLEDVFGKKPVADFVDPERIVAKIVATIDSLDREAIPLRERAVSNVPGLFQVQRSGDEFVLAASNAARYKPLILALKAADAGMIVKVYLHFYPLFQQAYHELGYPDADFNDRLIAIIDHLMQAPDLKGPVRLVRPKVLYQFADPALEQRSSGHKLLIRIGPESEAIVKGKLNEIRGLLVPANPPGKPQPPAAPRKP